MERIVVSLVKNAKGKDDEGYRNEFIKLVSTAQSIARKKNAEIDEEDDVVGRTN